MKIIKGPSGFGDAIYTRVAVEWLIANRPDDYIVQTKYENIFSDLSVETMNLSYRDRVDYDLKYLQRKNNKETNQFQDMLINANLPDIEFTSSLKKSTDDNLVIVIKPYAPMNAVDSSLPMKPFINEFDKLVTTYINDAWYLVIDQQYPFFELVDIFNSAKLVISQVGWAIPVAEMLDIPVKAIFTERALNSSNNFINTITPEKICSKDTTEAIILS